jgi:hypothetical protein
LSACRRYRITTSLEAALLITTPLHEFQAEHAPARRFGAMRHARRALRLGSDAEFEPSGRRVRLLGALLLVPATREGFDHLAPFGDRRGDIARPPRVADTLDLRVQTLDPARPH